MNKATNVALSKNNQANPEDHPRNASDLFIECLVSEGVSKIYGVPGEENEDFLFAIERNPNIEFIPTRHEQGAAFIANVWGRLTGEPGVCLSTLGPGATNLLTGVADANLDKAPLVAITGQGDITRLHHESHQLIDVVKMFEPVTKWNTSIKEATIIPEVVRKAFKIATASKPGATHIELSEDIARVQIDQRLQALDKQPNSKTICAQAAIDTAFDLLKNAEFPLVVVGNGAVRYGVYDVLEQLLHHSGLPVVATFMGKGAVSDKNPNSLLAFGLGFKDYVMEAVDKADTVLCIGYDIAEYSPDDWNPKSTKTIIHLDESPAEVYSTYVPKLELVGDIKSILQQLNQVVKAHGAPITSENWFAPIRQRILDDIKSYDLAPDEAFHVPGVLNIVRDILPANGIILSDVGAHKMWIARNFPTYDCNSCIISNGMASMGIALPGGIAAALLNDDRPTVALMGDGGFMMNVQELETAKRLGVALTIIVFNDNNYGLISWKQKREHDHAYGTALGNPDFVKLAESFGIKALKPQNKEELISFMEQSIRNKELALIEVPILSAVNQALVEKLKNYWSNT